jgi:hypothetical protein
MANRTNSSQFPTRTAHEMRLLGDYLAGWPIQASLGLSGAGIQPKLALCLAD